MRSAALILLAVLPSFAQTPGKLGFHAVRLGPDGKILSWYSAEPGLGYDHVLKKVWDYWRLMPHYWESGRAFEKDFGKNQGLRRFYVMRTQDEFGVGGDQFGMILSSWSIYYPYSGDRTVVDDMVEQADIYLKNSLSPPDHAWPNLPYPCNTKKRAVYDGDLIQGEGYTQPDKAGSFGAELVTLYKITGDRKYLDAATKIADTLASKIQPGDAEHSPLPFRVDTRTGASTWAYTTNWTPTLRLFNSLVQLKQGDVDAYRRASATISAWLKKYPLQTMKWGPFFEDIGNWSDTQINAVTLAWYILENPDWSATGPADARRCLDWAWTNLGVDKFLPGYGVRVMGEQTAYKMEGQSHTSRQSSVELRYAEVTGDASRKANAILGLNWSTYFVDVDGKNRYPNPETYELWWTDGYGDFVRHYIRAMAAAPELAPSNRDCLLRSSSVIREIEYGPSQIRYTAFDDSGEEVLRLTAKPRRMEPGWKWQALPTGGVLRVSRTGARTVSISK